MRRIPRPVTTLFVLTTAWFSGCATLGADPGRSLVPTRYKTQSGPYAIYTNFELPTDSPAVQHLQALERQIETTLGVRVDPGDSPIEVYILDDRRAFTHFLTYYYPELPPRRAFFFAQGPRRVVYTYLGDRLEEDLRHEATHALLHTAFADVPLWFDEGMAEYFEDGEAQSGLNLEHVQRLPNDLASGWEPNLRRLEGLRDVRQMTPRDYRESWAWVHYLLNSGPENRSILLAYLTDLHNTSEPMPLSERLEAAGLGNDGIPGPSSRLLAHLDHIRKQPVAISSQKPVDPGVRKATIRLQNEPVTIRTSPVPTFPIVTQPSRPVKPPRRPGFFQRLADSLFDRSDSP